MPGDPFISQFMAFFKSSAFNPANRRHGRGGEARRDWVCVKMMGLCHKGRFRMALWEPFVARFRLIGHRAPFAGGTGPAATMPGRICVTTAIRVKRPRTGSLYIQLVKAGHPRIGDKAVFGGEDERDAAWDGSFHTDILIYIRIRANVKRFMQCEFTPTVQYRPDYRFRRVCAGSKTEVVELLRSIA